MEKRKKGVFITFEGGEGGGKSTQIRRLTRYLKTRKRSVLVLREPGGTTVSEAIREILLNKKNTSMVPETELLLYLAARAQLVSEKVRPALEKGYVVILDRYEDSTRAYQGYGRGFPLRVIDWISTELVRGQLKPDLTIVFDLDPRIGLGRVRGRDRIESESMAFHRKVRQGFLQLARNEPRRFLVVDASQDKNTMTDQIRKAIGHVVR